MTSCATPPKGIPRFSQAARAASLTFNLTLSPNKNSFPNLLSPEVLIRCDKEKPARPARQRGKRRKAQRAHKGSGSGASSEGLSPGATALGGIQGFNGASGRRQMAPPQENRVPQSVPQGLENRVLSGPLAVQRGMEDLAKSLGLLR